MTSWTWRATTSSTRPAGFVPLFQPFCIVCLQLWTVPRFSADGRYMYAFADHSRLLVVDLFHGKQKVYKSPAGRKERYFGYFVPLNAITILILSKVYGQTFEDVGEIEVELLRLREDSDVFEPVLLERKASRPFQLFVFAEITGDGVDVKRAVLGKHGTINFCRLNVDEGRMEIFHTADTGHFFPHASVYSLPVFSVHLSANGEELYFFDENHLNALNVYSLTDKKWTEAAIDVGDWRPESSSVEFYWLAGVVYAKERYGKFFRCSLAEKKWQKMPLCPWKVEWVSPVVNPADGNGRRACGGA
ncbi:hypothetical protein M3Y99_00746100 [Aphelenchoides fujianensis]|nr:hypothetical protein M3Y99_00746100 [Aphelenchoides fujianensis]